jgi:hypothetical protein
MAKINNYSFHDPNDNSQQSADGDSYIQVNYGPCTTGVALKIFDGGTEVLFRCYQPGTLVITTLAKTYDCINGACIQKTAYNTPGIYNSLAECESICGTGCSGKCISNVEWAQIEGLANQLKSKNCS